MNDQAMQTYWQGKLERTGEVLESNNFAVWLAGDAGEANSIFWKQIYPEIKPKSVSFGGSLSLRATGLYDELMAESKLEVIDTYATGLSMEEVIDRRRRSLLVDCFLTGTNAVTKEGHLINLDGMGNRVAALTFGPKHVVLFIGRNKLVADLDEAISRIKEYAAPVNTIRLGRNTPCAQTMQCEDCKSPERICNTWTITEKSNPPQRVKIVLINQDLGY
jgi:hypothetical protein